MKISFETLSSTENAILMGDFNFGDTDENIEIPTDFSDVYREQYPEETINTTDRLGYTFDHISVRVGLSK